MLIKLYTFIVGIILLFSFYPNCVANEPDELLHKNCLYPTIRVLFNGHNDGTGFIVRSVKLSEKEYVNVFLTVAHVVDSYDGYTVTVGEYEDWSTLVNSHPYTAAIYAKDFERDIAIGTFLSEEKMPTVEIDLNTKLYIGNDVFHIGYGLVDDDNPRVDFGKITSVHSKMSSQYLLYRTSAHTVPGDSGGPLFNKYKVVGLCESIRVWRNAAVFNMSYYVPITHLRDWSKEENDAYDFVWKEKAIPKMAFWELSFTRDYKITKIP